MAIASTLRRRWVEVAWGAFAATNVAVILLLSSWETIPFHFVWVSLTLVYGFRRWRLRPTIVVMVVVILVTGGALAVSIVRGHEGPDELAEVPLMAAMFLAMVWHAERRQSAVEAGAWRSPSTSCCWASASSSEMPRTSCVRRSRSREDTPS